MALPHDLVEYILEKLPLKSLLRFKSVSIQWNSLIESRYFKEKLLVHRQSQDPDVLIINPYEFDRGTFTLSEENVTRMFTMNSSTLIKLPNPCPLPKPICLETKYAVEINYSISNSCDGMICYYNEYHCIHVVNPITRWFRSVPQTRYQAIHVDIMNEKIIPAGNNTSIKSWNLGFGKDKSTYTYKLVWLYNSFEFGLENVTTCEVFNFKTNIWRHVTAAPCRILVDQVPVYLDGSLYWFTDEHLEVTRILSLDLHTEVFHVLLKTPFIRTESNIKEIIMRNLNNQLCVSQKDWPKQEIWSLHNSYMIWEKIYSLNLQTDSHLFANHSPYMTFPYAIICVIPVAILKNKKKSLVLYDARSKNPNLVLYDPETRSYDICFHPDYWVHFTAIATSFFPSLISII